MKRIAVFLLFAGVLCAQSSFVHTQGKSLVTPDGQKLMLRGINLGNWLEPEGYMFLFEGGAQAPREIEQLFNELVGPEEAQKFWRTYRDEYITEQDIAFIHKAGFNSVRIPLHYKFFSADGEGFAYLDRVIEWCKKAGLWVILDLHCAPGGQTGTNIDDSWGYPWLFESPQEQQATIDVWKRLAQHYRDNQTVLGYDLLNEPIPHFPQLQQYNARLEPLYRRIATGVREVDSNHVLILAGAQWDSNFKVFGAPFDKNVMYTFHKYWMPPEQKAIQEYVDFRDRYSVPIWLGESGENDDKWIAEFAKLLETNDIGWCFWPYKKMMKSSAPVSFEKPVHWDAIVAYAKEPGNTGEAEKRLGMRPSLADSRAALDDLLVKIRFENCKVNKGYLEALGLNGK
jgi:endoglucanase